MEENIYKKLYYHAFNRYTALLEQVEKVQQELEQIYLESDEKDKL